MFSRFSVTYRQTGRMDGLKELSRYAIASRGKNDSNLVHQHH